MATTNYVQKSSDGTAIAGLTDSTIFDNGSVGIGTTTPDAKLTIKLSAADQTGFDVLNSLGNAVVNGSTNASNNGEIHVRNSGGTIAVNLQSGASSYLNGTLTVEM